MPAPAPPAPPPSRRGASSGMDASSGNVDVATPAAGDGVASSGSIGVHTGAAVSGVRGPTASACGGGGTCIQCTCQVHSGGGGILPTEEPHFTRKEISENYRLGCQVKVKDNMAISITEEVFGVFFGTVQLSKMAM